MKPCMIRQVRVFLSLLKLYMCLSGIEGVRMLELVLRLLNPMNWLRAYRNKANRPSLGVERMRDSYFGNQELVEAINDTNEVVMTIETEDKLVEDTYTKGEGGWEVTHRIVNSKKTRKQWIQRLTELGNTVYNNLEDEDISRIFETNDNFNNSQMVVVFKACTCKSYAFYNHLKIEQLEALKQALRDRNEAAFKSDMPSEEKLLEAFKTNTSLLILHFREMDASVTVFVKDFNSWVYIKTVTRSYEDFV